MPLAVAPISSWAVESKNAATFGPTALAVAAERAFLRTLEGGCQVPVAAHATLEGNDLRLHGRVVSLGGERSVEGQERTAVRSDAEADRLGIRLAERLLDDGAGDILAQVRAATAPAVPEP